MSIEQDRATVGQYGDPSQAMEHFMAGAKGKEIPCFDEEPGHLVTRLAQVIEGPGNIPGGLQNAIDYVRSYVRCWYHPAKVPCSITERINTLEDQWRSRQRGDG